MSAEMLIRSDCLLAEIPGTGFLFGLVLMAAIIGGYLTYAVHIPRVVGYLLGGMVLKIILYRFLNIEPNSSEESAIFSSAAPFKAIKDLGLGMILFSIGGVFEARHLRAVGAKIVKISLGESSLTFALVFLGAAVVSSLSAHEVSAGTILGFSLLLGFAAIATAPAATIFVLHEYSAKGPATDTILSLTGLNNVVCIITFYLAFSLLAATGVIGGVDLASRNIWIDLLTMTLGSMVLGFILGFVISILYAKLPVGETILILVAILILTGAGEGWLLNHYGIALNFLLTVICMGAMFANVAVDPHRLEESLRTIGRPILVGFFGIAGFKLHLSELVGLPLLGGVYVFCRLLGKVLGTRLGLRWSNIKDAASLRPNLGLALLCQAAVVIGLADFIGTYWSHPWAHRFSTVVMGSIVIFEICGPLLVKWIVKQSGEVKAVTLLRRTPSPISGGMGVTSFAWHALLQALGLGRSIAEQGDAPLEVRHIMRTNVKCISANANLDEVLHIVEHSRLNHFPVVDKDQLLLGVIHFSDIREILYDPFLSRLMTAVDLANPDTSAVPADMPMAEAFHVFQEGDVGSLSVVESAGSRTVVGVLEQRDLLRAMHEHPISSDNTD